MSLEISSSSICEEFMKDRYHLKNTYIWFNSPGKPDNFITFYLSAKISYFNLIQSSYVASLW